VAGHALAASRLAEDGHVVIVATERTNIALDPAQRQLLIHQAIVGELVVLRVERRVCQKAKCAQAVVERDDHDVPTVDEVGRIEVVALTGDQ
jgi:hypothetical protein